MKKSTIITIVIAFLVLIISANGCSTYNSFIDKSEGVDKAWAQVQTQYQRRYDLIPNLVSVVKGYAEHEKTTYENVTRARAGLDSAVNVAKTAEVGDLSSQADFQRYTQAQNDLNKSFNVYVNAVKEAYPDLKANEQFRDLQVQIEGTENRINYARNEYTELVQAYNLRVRKFPARIWASIFGFEPKPQYVADTEAQAAPKVSF